MIKSSKFTEKSISYLVGMSRSAGLGLCKTYQLLFVLRQKFKDLLGYSKHILKLLGFASLRRG